MAHKTQITVNGMVFEVTEFDNSAQRIDDAVNKVMRGNVGVEIGPNEPENVSVWIDTNNNELKYKDPETGQWESAGGGGNAITVDGGATMTLEGDFGDGPHEIHVTEENDEKWLYKDIGAAPATMWGTEDVEDGSPSPYPEGTLYVVIK